MTQNHPFHMKHLLRREQTKLRIIKEEKGDYCENIIDELLEGTQ
jgi:hypothetical protein